MISARGDRETNASLLAFMGVSLIQGRCTSLNTGAQGGPAVTRPHRTQGKPLSLCTAFPGIRGKPLSLRTASSGIQGKPLPPYGGSRNSGKASPSVRRLTEFRERPFPSVRRLPESRESLFPFVRRLPGIREKSFPSVRRRGEAALPASAASAARAASASSSASSAGAGSGDAGGGDLRGDGPGSRGSGSPEASSASGPGRAAEASQAPRAHRRCRRWRARGRTGLRRDEPAVHVRAEPEGQEVGQPFVLQPRLRSGVRARRTLRQDRGAGGTCGWSRRSPGSGRC